MSDTSTHTTETMERKPPTLADIVREKTDDGKRIIDFFLDVMEDRIDGFKTHHRIAAAKELIVHIVRDEQPSHTPSPSTVEGGARPESPRTACPVLDTGSEGDSLNSERRAGLIPPLPQGEGWGEGDTSVDDRRRRTHRGHSPRRQPSSVVPATDRGEPRQLNRRSRAEEGNPDNSTVVPAQTEGNPDNSTVVPAQTEGNPDNSTVVPAEAGTQGGGGARNTAANPAHPEPSSTVVPAEAGTQGGRRGP